MIYRQIINLTNAWSGGKLTANNKEPALTGCGSAGNGNIPMKDFLQPGAVTFETVTRGSVLTVCVVLVPLITILRNTG